MKAHIFSAVPAVFVLACASLSAQTTFTSPAGFSSTEAPYHDSTILASVDGLRFQQVDASARGNSGSLVSIAFRRDASTASNSAFGARTLSKLSVLLGTGRVGAVSRDLDANYLATPITVFDAKDVVTPDWTAQPSGSPAPFDFKLSFDRPYVYSGSADLLWELRVQAVTASPAALRNFPFDAAPLSSSLETVNRGTTLGSGCRTSNGEFLLRAHAINRSTSFSIQHSANNAPLGAAVVSFLDFSDANTSIPGVCTTLRASPLVLLPMGQASVNGAVAVATAGPFPHSGSFIGIRAYLQAVALDSSQSGLQLALSTGNQVVMPANPSLPVCARAFSYTTLGEAIEQGPYPGGIIAQFELR